ncbi:hypothetical protein GGS21DRAFT_355658 [Xylaria nigripes]|nr:hypothetical protein GGS21DRAFT_355658 [Xylaria nigripes]
MAASSMSDSKEPPAVPPSSTSTQSSSHFQAQSEAQPESEPESEPEIPRVDGKSYYGYLFKEDKSPTDTLDLLLRAIGQYVIDYIGDTNDKQLNARKLAAFYRAVGGDFDRFLESPDRTISYIWHALGVQYSLQPIPDDDFAAPSIPALTLRGFVRWQSLQLLLAPEENVPYLQYAVENWNLKNPYTGDPFPADLPATAFPAVCDPDIDEWHRACGQRLREAATHNEEDEQPPPQRPDSDPHIRTTHGHESHSTSTSPGTTPRQQPESEFIRHKQPMPFVHVSEPRHSQHAAHASPPTVLESSRRMSNSSSSSLEDFVRMRRRPDIKPQPVLVREDTRSSTHSDAHRPATARRHSHSPYVASIADSDSDSDTLRASPRSVPQPSIIRRIPISTPPPASTSSRSRHSEVRADDPWRSRLAGINHKLSPFLNSPSSRQRSSSRERMHQIHPSARSRKDTPRIRLSRSLSGESYTSDDSLLDITPKYSLRDSREHNRARDRVIERELERELEREREREREQKRERERERAREWEELDRKNRKDKNHYRPSINRRTSSHADIDRRRQDVAWDTRDRRPDNREMKRDFRRNLTSDELDRRERRRYQEHGLSPSMANVGGRMYR